jgi:uncharacterized membrane protein YoaK (UPF0700 family)
MFATARPSDPPAAARTPAETPTVALALLLTLVTGVVDSVGYLGLDRVFVGNMTGNIVILGMGVAGADELPVFGPLTALAAFTLAAFVTGLTLRAQPSGWTTRVGLCLAAGSAALAACAIALVVLDPDTHHDSLLIVATVTAAAMGAQAAASRKLAVKDMPTVVVTSTLVSLASESWTAGGSAALWNRRAGAIAAILVGALIGAIILRHSGIGYAMATAALLSTAATAIGHWRLRARR